MSTLFECGCVWSEASPAWCAICRRCLTHCVCSSKQFAVLLTEAARQYNIAHEKFTQKQLMEAFRQALECGDFVRYVSVEGNAQQVVYLPFAEQGWLKARISELEEQCKECTCKHACG